MVMCGADFPAANELRRNRGVCHKAHAPFLKKRCFVDYALVFKPGLLKKRRSGDLLRFDRRKQRDVLTTGSLRLHEIDDQDHACTAIR